MNTVRAAIARVGGHPALRRNSTRSVADVKVQY